MNRIISILGIQTELVPILRNRLKGLNADLLLRFTYYTALFNHKDLCIIQSKSLEPVTPLKYRKITEQIEKITGMPAVVLVESLPYRERERLISQGVYFIVSDKYAFLPSLIANIRVKEKECQPPGLTPVAQYLLLYYLSGNQDAEFTIRQLETVLPYNYVALARAVVNLEGLQLCETQKDDAGTKVIHFEQNKRELWKKAQKYLSPPVKKIVYSDTLSNGNFRISGINALAHYSRLNPEQNETVAVWDRDFADLSMPFNEIEGIYKIEIWKYSLFMPYPDNGKCVDKLSLYLSLKEESDARVEKELEILIENMQW
jgi:hypothetical protein